MKRSSTHDVLQTFSSMRRYRNAHSRKSALICPRIVPASLGLPVWDRETENLPPFLVHRFFPTVGKGKVKAW